MLSLNSRKDGFRLLLPKEFLHPDIEEKYTKILSSKHSFFNKPIDFVNETIQQVQVMGFNNATVQQQQSYTGEPVIYSEREAENKFMFPSSEYNYRSGVSPISLTDRTLNITFRHTLGYLNYFILFENFWYQFSRDMKYKDLVRQFNVDIINEVGEIYSRIILMDPIVNGMDMLDFDYTQPKASNQSFKVEFKYSNFDYEFIQFDDLKP